MDIHDLGSAERLTRKRQSDAARSTVSSPASHPSLQDDAVVQGVDAASISRLVDRLKGMDPSNAHRVEQLRIQIRDGTYAADPDALAEAFISDDGR